MNLKKQLNLVSFLWTSTSLFAVLNAPGNSANDLVDIINKNRTGQKLPQLSNSPGLGCIALQYAEECMGNCSSNNTVNCHPSDDDFTEIFAPNCGVELPTFGTIAGYILSCQPKYLEPLEAFSNVLVHDKRTLSLLKNKTHTEVGIGIIKAHKHKGPYVWCVLFSSSQRNTTFLLDDLGEGIKQKRGCYSGTSFPCSRAHRDKGLLSNKIGILVLFCVIFFQEFLLKLFWYYYISLLN